MRLFWQQGVAVTLMPLVTEIFALFPSTHISPPGLPLVDCFFEESTERMSAYRCLGTDTQQPFASSLEVLKQQHYGFAWPVICIFWQSRSNCSVQSLLLWYDLFTVSGCLPMSAKYTPAIASCISRDHYIPTPLAYACSRSSTIDVHQVSNCPLYIVSKHAAQQEMPVSSYALVRDRVVITVYSGKRIIEISVASEMCILFAQCTAHCVRIYTPLSYANFYVCYDVA